MKVLGEHLYSSPNVAIRELVQNAHDSCTRRRLEHPDAPFEGPANNGSIGIGGGSSGAFNLIAFWNGTQMVYCAGLAVDGLRPE